MNRIVFFVWIAFISVGQAQHTLNCLNGYWESSKLSRTEEDKLDYQIRIIKDHKSIIIYGTDRDWSEWIVSGVGFINTENFWVKDTLRIGTDILEEGEYFVQFDYIDSIHVTNIFGCMIYSCKDEDWMVGNGSPSWYGRLNKLSYNVIQYLFNQSKLLRHDLILEYMEMEIRNICVEQLDVYESPNGQDTGDVMQDELVEVLETNEDWVRIKSLKTALEGWIYDSCLE